jgi:hypothetical protein
MSVNLKFDVSRGNTRLAAGRVKIPQTRLKKDRSQSQVVPPPHLVPLPLERMYGAMFKYPLVTVLCLATIASAASLTDSKL